jgi:hypothetical protein
MKTFFIENGMMLGQFHPLCPAPAARNPTFKNKISPIPLFALRHIAAHDILFLHTRPDWFERYRSLYGERYERKEFSDERGFVKIYREALQRFNPELMTIAEEPIDPIATWEV